MAVKKPTARKLNPLSGNKSSGTLEMFETRIFEVVRKKAEFDLDVQVTQALEQCREYLRDTHGRSPNMNGVVEAIILEGLSNNTEFQKWLDDQERKAAKKDDESLDAEEKKIVDNIGMPSHVGQQKVVAGGGAPA